MTSKTESTQSRWNAETRLNNTAWPATILDADGAIDIGRSATARTKVWVKDIIDMMGILEQNGDADSDFELQTIETQIATTFYAVYNSLNDWEKAAFNGDIAAC